MRRVGCAGRRGEGGGGRGVGGVDCMVANTIWPLAALGG